MRRRTTLLLLLVTPLSVAWSAQSIQSSTPARHNSYHERQPQSLLLPMTSAARTTFSSNPANGGSTSTSAAAAAAAAANLRRRSNVPVNNICIGKVRSGSVLVQSVASGGATAAAASPPPDDTNPTLPIGVVAVLCAAFLNLLGFTMAGPITPALGSHFNLEVGTKFGALTSAYPLGMLFGLFIWPQFSDRRGRKPVMALSLLGSAIGLALQSFAIRSNWSLAVFLASRVLTGCFAGSSPVSKAYLADIGSKQGFLPRYLALRDAASTLAFILGPTLGGLFYEARRATMAEGSAAASAAVDATSSLAFVIGTSAVASLVASLFIVMFVDEESAIDTTKTQDQAGSSDSTKKSELAYEEDIISCPLGTRLWTGVASVCVVSFQFNVGDSTFFAFFPALLKFMGLDARSIGLAFTSFACISFAVSTTVTGRCIRRHGPVTTCIAGLSAIGSGLIALSGASAMKTAIPALVFGAAALYYCGVPLYGPTVPTMLLRCVPPNRRGAVMGLDGAVNTVGRVIAPLLMGNLYRTSGPSATFGVAGVAALSAAVIALIRRFLVLRVGEATIDISKSKAH